MRGLLLLFLFVLMQAMNAQPLARYNLYPFNPDFANPAATGLTDCLLFNVTDMHQWIGIDDAPNTQSFSIQKGTGFLKNKKYGLGVNLIRDSNGPSKSLGGEFLYSYHMLIGRDRKNWLSFGLSGNIEQRRLDESGFSPIFDPGVTGGIVQEMAYNASAGIYLYNESYFAGVAVYNLLPENNTLAQDTERTGILCRSRGDIFLITAVCLHEFKPPSRGASEMMYINLTCQEKCCLKINYGRNNPAEICRQV